MKILRKILIVCCFSFLFITINVNALSSQNINYTTAVLNNYFSNHSGKTIEDFFKMIIDGYDLKNQFLNHDNYLIAIDTYDNGTNGNIFWFETDGTLMLWNTSSKMGISTSKNGRTYQRVCNQGITFNTLGEYTGISGILNCVTNQPSYTEKNFPFTIAYSNYEYATYNNNNAYFPGYSYEADSQRITINGTNYNYNTNIPINGLKNVYYNYEITDMFTSNEPSYEVQQQILENGNVKLTFNFTNYDSNNGYGFTITNKVSGEEYGIANPFTTIYPNIIPFGNNYEIELSYDTIITVSLSRYTLIEGTQLYDREPLYVDSYDINNIVFSDPQKPYFSIISQTQNNLIGKYNNTKTGDVCGHIYSNNNIEWTTNCNENVDIDFSLNGYVEMYVKRNNNIIYSRKINYIAQNQNQPYIEWSVEKQDFYSVINWKIKNYDNQMTYRISKDNGSSYTNWSNASEESYINVYDNNTIIIDIANNDQSVIYDTKAINVVNDIKNLGNKNNTTINFIDKFASIFSANENILNNINEYWGIIKNSKLYLLIFIPFITSIICGIIYLIRKE